MSLDAVYYRCEGNLPCRYFAPPEATDALKGSTLRSAKYALGPSFGTLSLGSLVLTLIELARQALQQWAQFPHTSLCYAPGLLCNGVMRQGHLIIFG